MEQQESETVEKLSEKLKSTSANLGGRRETFERLKQILDDYISDMESLVGTSIRNGKIIKKEPPISTVMEIVY